MNDRIVTPNARHLQNRLVKQNQFKFQNFLQTIFSIFTLNICNILDNGKRPFIKVNVDGFVSPWLFDTGAEVCCMSTQAFRLIPVHKRPQKVFFNKDLRCASNTALRVRGTYLMNLNVLEKKY